MISGDLMIFLDTGYFKGLMDKKDQHHDDAGQQHLARFPASAGECP